MIHVDTFLEVSPISDNNINLYILSLAFGFELHDRAQLTLNAINENFFGTQHTRSALDTLSAPLRIEIPSFKVDEQGRWPNNLYYECPTENHIIVAQYYMFLCNQQPHIYHLHFNILDYLPIHPIVNHSPPTTTNDD